MLGALLASLLERVPVNDHPAAAARCCASTVALEMRIRLLFEPTKEPTFRIALASHHDGQDRCGHGGAASPWFGEPTTPAKSR